MLCREEEDPYRGCRGLWTIMGMHGESDRGLLRSAKGVQLSIGIC